MPKARYEFVGGTSNKFWEIEKPVWSAGWVVSVHFGRIGTNGQHHINVFSTDTAAAVYYDKKVSEKIAKGYKHKHTKHTLTASPVIPKKEKPACEHLQLRKTGEFKWECNACKTHIEFDKLQKAAASPAEEITQMRRFIDLSALRG
jgi:predicted DNA-binding WGR domain protein